MANMSFRMDDHVKQDFTMIVEEMGLTPSAAMNLFAKAVVRERKIPFEIALRDDLFYGEANQKHIRKSLEEFDKGNVVVKTIEELEAMAADE